MQQLVTRLCLARCHSRAVLAKKVNHQMQRTCCTCALRSYAVVMTCTQLNRANIKCSISVFSTAMTPVKVTPPAKRCSYQPPALHTLLSILPGCLRCSHTIMLPAGELLGQGGFADVHAAELSDPLLPSFTESVAVKRLRPDVLKSPDDLREFLTEANLLRKLQHRWGHSCVA